MDGIQILATTNDSSRSLSPTAEKVAPYALLGLTAVTGLVDAVCYLSLGRVLTANMLILAFATARIPGLSVAPSSTALVSFVLAAMLGGRIMSPTKCKRGYLTAGKGIKYIFIKIAHDRFCFSSLRLQPLTKDEVHKGS